MSLLQLCAAGLAPGLLLSLEALRLSSASISLGTRIRTISVTTGLFGKPSRDLHRSRSKM